MVKTQQQQQQQDDVVYGDGGDNDFGKASGICMALCILTGWLMTCIATALAQQDCQNNCADRYRYTWWVIVWAIFHYTILAGLAFTGALRASKNAMLAFTVLLTSQMMPVTNLGIRAVNGCYATIGNTYYANVGSYGGQAVTYYTATSADQYVDLCPGDVALNLSVAVSGWVLMMMCNFILIIGLGIVTPQPAASRGVRKEGMYGQSAPVAA